MYSKYKIRFLTIFCIPSFFLLTGCFKANNSPDLNQETIIFEFHEDRAGVDKGGGYVGSKVCKRCHYEQYITWEKTRHARSYNTLYFKNKHEDRNCLRCHTTGFGKSSGFKSIDETEDLAVVGCESCHGPSLEHINAKTEAKKESIYGISGDCKKCEYIKFCIRCHNLENDPGFNFDRDIKEIDH